MKCNQLSKRGKSQFNIAVGILGENVANDVVNEYSTFDGFNNKPSGVESVLFKRLDNHYNEKIATEIYASLLTPAFKSEFGDWLHDDTQQFYTNEVGEPLLKEDNTSLYIEIPKGKYVVWNKSTIDIGKTSVKVGRKLSVKLPTYIPLAKNKAIGKEAAKNMYIQLSETFKKHGVEINIEEDYELNTEVVVKDGTIFYNPNSIKNNSFFHKFSQIYIALAKDKTFIDAGIEQLRGSQLWNDLYEIYPHYTDKQLGLEVLATKIGEEAATFNDSNFKFWLNRLFYRVSNVLGINVNVSQELAIDLVRGNLTKTIAEERGNVIQRKRDNNNIDSLLIINKFIAEVRNPLNNYIKKDGQFQVGDKFTGLSYNLQSALKTFDNKKNRNDIGWEDRLAMVTSITQHDLHWIQQVEHELFSLYQSHIGKDGARDIKPFTSSEESRQFADELKHIKLQLETFVHLRNLEEFTKADLEGLVKIVETNGVRSYEPFDDASFDDADRALAIVLSNLSNIRINLSDRVNAMDNRFDSIQALFGKMIIASNSNPDEVRHAATIFNKELTDETLFQKYFMNNYDSTNILVSMSEDFRRNLQYANQLESDKIKSKFKALIKKLGGFSKDDFKYLYTDDDNENLFSLIGEYDMVAFQKAYDKFLVGSDWTSEEIAESINAITIKIDREVYIKEITKQYNISINAKNKRAGAKAFAIWMKDNFEFSPTASSFDFVTGAVEEGLGGYVPKLGGKFKMPSDEFKSNKYAKIHDLDANGNKSKYGQMYDFLFETQQYLLNHTIGKAEHNGALPIINTEQQSSKVPLVEQRNDKGELIRTIRFTNVADAINTPLFYIPRKDVLMSEEEYETYVVDYINTRHSTGFTTISEIEDKNESIEKENVKKLEQAVSYDLENIFPMFITSTMIHKYKTSVEAHYQSTLASLKLTGVVKTNANGAIMIDTSKRDSKGNIKSVKLKNEYSNVVERFEKDMDMKLYDNFLTYSPLNEVGQHVRNGVALLGLGFNVFSTAKNIGMGKTQIRMEAKAGVHFNTKDAINAEKEYFGNMVSILKSSGEEYATSKTASILNMLNIIDDYDDILERVNNLDVIKESTSSLTQTRKKASKIFNKAAYFLTVSAENNMHNQTVLAMINGHRLIDGKIVSRFDFVTSYGRPSKDEIKADRTKLNAYIRNKKANKKKAELAFLEAGISLRDIFETTDSVNGYTTTLKVDKNDKTLVSIDEFARFRSRIQGVNHKMHGIYNREDKGIIENKILGVHFMQFHHWLPAAWAKRFGPSGNPFSTVGHWNERRKAYEIGDYTATRKMMRVPYLDNVSEMKGDRDTLEFTEYAEAWFKGAFEFITNARLYYHLLNESEQRGVIRTMNELGTASVLMLLGVGMAKRAPDEDDSVAYIFAYNMLKYTIGGVSDELIGLTPGYGWTKEFYKFKKSPTPSFSYLESVLKLTLDVTKYPFRTDKERVYRSGINKGKDKVITQSLQFVPFWNNTFRRFDKFSNAKYKAKNYSMWSW